MNNPILDENAKTLVRLGLTKLQAKVYLTLTKLRTASVKTIAENAQIDRSHVYQLVNKLQKIGLVQKILSNPNLFKAISLQEGLQILLERKTEELSELGERTKEMIQRNNENRNENEFQDTNSEFTLIPGREVHIRVFVKLFEKTQTSYDGIFIRQEDFCRYILMDNREGTTKKLLQRGVKFRLLVCNPENNRLPPRVSKIIMKLNEKGTFNIRYRVSPAAAMFGIIDKKDLFINIGSASDWMEKPSLQTNNPSLVDIAQGYFEHMWHISAKN